VDRQFIGIPLGGYRRISHVEASGRYRDHVAAFVDLAVAWVSRALVVLLVADLRSSRVHVIVCVIAIVSAAGVAHVGISVCIQGNSQTHAAGTEIVHRACVCVVAGVCIVRVHAQVIDTVVICARVAIVAVLRHGALLTTLISSVQQAVTVVVQSIDANGITIGGLDDPRMDIRVCVIAVDSREGALRLGP
jgi:hypothetical protein